MTSLRGRRKHLQAGTGEISKLSGVARHYIEDLNGHKDQPNTPQFLAVEINQALAQLEAFEKTLSAFRERLATEVAMFDEYLELTSAPPAKDGSLLLAQVSSLTNTVTGFDISEERQIWAENAIGRAEAARRKLYVTDFNTSVKEALRSAPTRRTFRRMFLARGNAQVLAEAMQELGDTLNHRASSEASGNEAFGNLSVRSYELAADLLSDIETFAEAETSFVGMIGHLLIAPRKALEQLTPEFATAKKIATTDLGATETMLSEVVRNCEVTDRRLTRLALDVYGCLGTKRFTTLLKDPPENVAVLDEFIADLTHVMAQTVKHIETLREVSAEANQAIFKWANTVDEHIADLADVGDADTFLTTLRAILERGQISADQFETISCAAYGLEVPDEYEFDWENFCNQLDVHIASLTSTSGLRRFTQARLLKATPPSLEQLGQRSTGRVM